LDLGDLSDCGFCRTIGLSKDSYRLRYVSHDGPQCRCAARKKRPVIRRSVGHRWRKRTRNRVPRPPANNTVRARARIRERVPGFIPGVHDSPALVLPSPRFRPSAGFYFFSAPLPRPPPPPPPPPPSRPLLPRPAPRAASLAEERKGGGKERGTEKERRDRGRKKGESGGDRKEEKRGRVSSSPPRTSPRSLFRLDVIKTKPRAGPPSRRLINCFVRDTSLFKRNWAFSSSFSFSLRFSWPLDHPAHPAHPSDSYLFVQRVRNAFQARRRHREYRDRRARSVNFDEKESRPRQVRGDKKPAAKVNAKAILLRNFIP